MGHNVILWIFLGSRHAKALREHRDLHSADDVLLPQEHFAKVSGPTRTLRRFYNKKYEISGIDQFNFFCFLCGPFEGRDSMYLLIIKFHTATIPYSIELVLPHHNFLCIFKKVGSDDITYCPT